MFLFSILFRVIYGFVTLSDFLIFPKVLHSFEGVVVVGGQQIGKTRFLSLGSDFVFVSVPIVDALTVPNIPQTLKMELKHPRYRAVKHS